MQAHHTLMVKHDDSGNVNDHKEIANNLWGRYRRAGWEFATQEEQQDFVAGAVERAKAAAKAQTASPENKPGDGPLEKKKKTTPKEKVKET